MILSGPVHRPKARQSQLHTQAEPLAKALQALLGRQAVRCGPERVKLPEGEGLLPPVDGGGLLPEDLPGLRGGLEGLQQQRQLMQRIVHG